MSLEKKINQKTAKIGVVGLGYVGLPLAIELVKSGFNVTGIDVDKTKIRKIENRVSYISDVKSEDLRNLSATTDNKILGELDIIIICVPTPLTKTREPDLSYITSASRNIAKYLKKEQLIILESTTYPGTTEEIVLPILKSSGLRVGRDFYLVFSPERIDPGSKGYILSEVPKVVGGITKECTETAKLFYSQIFKEVIPVSSPKTAEMTKLLENIFRSVNIALVNELALLCNKMDISIWDVIEAASTKPYGFMQFHPGPGLGGHCIPVDPFYLSWKAKEYGIRTKFIELAGEINENMPHHVVSRVMEILNDSKKTVRGSNILVLGVAYKRDVNDARLSPALKIIELLMEKGANVAYHDPHIPKTDINGKILKSTELNRNLLNRMDCTIITTDHSSYDYRWIADNSKLLLDTRNATKGIEGGIIRL